MSIVKDKPLTKEDILAYLREHKQEFEEKYGIVKIGLFGSYARDEQTEDSDIDIAIMVKSKDYVDIENRYDFTEEIESRFTKKVDVGYEDSLRWFAKENYEREAIYV